MKQKTKKMWKKIITLVLILVLCSSHFANAAFAETVKSGLQEALARGADAEGGLLLLVHHVVDVLPELLPEEMHQRVEPCAPDFKIVLRCQRCRAQAKGCKKYQN